MLPPTAAFASSFSGISATAASVVKNTLAIDEEFCKALLVTLVGSTIPASIMFTYSSLYASNPISGSAFITFCTITAPSRPAFIAICLNGSSNAFLIILAPIASSPSNSDINLSTAGITLTSAVPPPATIPS